MWTGGGESKDYSTELTKERIDNMKLKQIFGALLSVAVLTTTVAMSQMTVYAVSTFASANEFLEDVIDVALTEIDSSTKDAAVATTMTKFSVADDAVSFNGSVIGYWGSSTSNTLYADAGKTIEIITETANGYEAKPSVLYTILNDVNSNIVENYVPTTADWSKIIGKYDVTLGDVTIPADQWVNVTPDTDPLVNGKTINFTKLFNVKPTEMGPLGNRDKTVQLMSYIIDGNGELYLSEYLYVITSDYTSGPKCSLNKLGNTALEQSDFTKSGTGYSHGNMSYLRAGLTQNEDTANRIVICFYETDTANSNYSYLPDAYIAEAYGNYVKVSDPALKYTGDLTDVTDVGILYMSPEQFGPLYYANSTAIIGQTHNKMFESYSCSKRTRGNQKLTRRLSTLAGLSATDTVEVKATGWTVNGGVDIDQYLGSQSLLNAGDTADIAAVADIDALKFHVIVPTTLPIYVDDANVTYVADNADITNKSGAAVKLTDVEITPVAESGWTMVDTTPSSEIGANEFTFSTTIEKNRVLTISEVYPFEYRAKLSPTTEASTSLELATVMVTVDWADAQQGG